MGNRSETKVRHPIWRGERGEGESGSGLEQGDRDSGSGWSAGWEAVGVRGGCDEGCESVTCRTSCCRIPYKIFELFINNP